MLPSLPSGLATTKALGFTQVETAGTYGHTAKEFRSLADLNGLKIVGSHIDYKRMQTDLPGVIAELKALGASYACVAWIPHDGDFTVEMAKEAAANFNPDCATAGRITIAQVEHLVEPGEIDPASVHTPGVFVQRVVHVPNPTKLIEKETVRQ